MNQPVGRLGLLRDLSPRQVRLRKDMLVTVGQHTEDDHDHESPDSCGVCDDALFDLSLVDPNEVAGALAEESQMLEELHGHMVEVKENIKNEEMATGLVKMQGDIEKIMKALGVK